MRRAAIVAAALVVALVASWWTPGPTAKQAPSSVIGIGSADVGSISISVHDVTIARSVVIDGESFETRGVFVVFEAELGRRGAGTDVIGRELVIGQTVYDEAAAIPAGSEDEPTPGFPVRGDLVFEIDPQLLGTPGAFIAQLRIAEGYDPSRDLVPQAVAVVPIVGTVVESVDIEPVEVVS